MINREKKFVFIHITKTGGQSIENVFGFHRKDNNKGEKRGKKWGMGWSNEHNYWFGHMTMKQYLDNGLLTEDEFNSFFKFSFVRNPWSRMVSEWRWKFRGLPVTFTQFLKNKWLIRHHYNRKAFNQHLRPQYLSIYDEDRLLVDFVGRMENMESGWKVVADRVGVDLSLPHINKSKHKHYTEYYTQELRDLVATKYERDIELFGYEFK